MGLFRRHGHGLSAIPRHHRPHGRRHWKHPIVVGIVLHKAWVGKRGILDVVARGWGSAVWGIGSKMSLKLFKLLGGHHGVGWHVWVWESLVWLFGLFRHVLQIIY